MTALGDALSSFFSAILGFMGVNAGVSNCLTTCGWMDWIVVRLLQNAIPQHYISPSRPHLLALFGTVALHLDGVRLGNLCVCRQARRVYNQDVGMMHRKMMMHHRMNTLPLHGTSCAVPLPHPRGHLKPVLRFLCCCFRGYDSTNIPSPASNTPNILFTSYGSQMLL